SRSLPKNLIRSPELTILTLEPLDPLKLRRPRARPLALIPLRLPHPAPQRVTRATDLLRHRLDRRPLRRVFPLGVQHQPNRPLPDLSGVPLCLVHDPNPSKIAASGKPRAVQTRCGSGFEYEHEYEYEYGGRTDLALAGRGGWAVGAGAGPAAGV